MPRRPIDAPVPYTSSAPEPHPAAPRLQQAWMHAVIPQISSETSELPAYLQSPCVSQLPLHMTCYEIVDWPEDARDVQELQLRGLRMISSNIANQMRVVNVAEAADHTPEDWLGYSYETGSLLLCGVRVGFHDAQQMIIAVPVFAGIWQPIIRSSVGMHWIYEITAEVRRHLRKRRIERIINATELALENITNPAWCPWLCLTPGVRGTAHYLQANNNATVVQAASHTLRRIHGDCTQSWSRQPRNLTRQEAIARELRSWIDEQTFAMQMTESQFCRVIMEMLSAETTLVTEETQAVSPFSTEDTALAEALGNLAAAITAGDPPAAPEAEPTNQEVFRRYSRNIDLHAARKGQNGKIHTEVCAEVPVWDPGVLGADQRG